MVWRLSEEEGGRGDGAVAVLVMVLVVVSDSDEVTEWAARPIVLQPDDCTMDELDSLTLYATVTSIGKSSTGRRWYALRQRPTNVYPLDEPSAFCAFFTRL